MYGNILFDFSHFSINQVLPQNTNWKERKKYISLSVQGTDNLSSKIHLESFQNYMPGHHVGDSDSVGSD